MEYRVGRCPIYTSNGNAFVQFMPCLLRSFCQVMPCSCYGDHLMMPPTIISVCTIRSFYSCASSKVKHFILMVSANFIFYALDALEFIGFLILSFYWPELMRCWQTTESLPIFKNCTYKRTYIRRIRIITVTVLVLAFGTFVFSSFLWLFQFSFEKFHHTFTLLYYSWTLAIY